MLDQDALALEPQLEARSQDLDIVQETCEEKQVTILLEGAEAKPANGERNFKALESIEH